MKSCCRRASLLAGVVPRVPYKIQARVPLIRSSRAGERSEESGLLRSLAKASAASRQVTPD